MRRIFFTVTLLIAGLTVFGQKMTPEGYIATYKNIAIREMHRSGVPASITLAQGLLETESGNSELLKQSNNHFGIKCKSDWTGPSVSHDDDKPGECFRVYNSAEESYKDHSDFLRNGSRYAFLFKLDPHDYKGWANGLRKAGYATNPKYSEKLIGYIQKYQLDTISLSESEADSDNTQQQTAMVVSSEGGSSQAASPAETSNDWSIVWVNGLKAVRASAGTSLLAIATRFNLRLEKLKEMNDLNTDGLLPTTQNIFLEKKKKEGEKLSVVNDRSQTLYNLSQQEGILVASLEEYNRKSRSEIIDQGVEVYLKPFANNQSLSQHTAENSLRQNIHIVAPKEGLYAISKKYGVSIDQLKSWNGLAGDQLQIGQKLIISQ